MAKQTKNISITEDDALLIDDNKQYSFQLIQRFDSYQPVDETNNSVKMANGFPPLTTLPNSGLARNEKGDIAQWRLIVGQPSIWVEDQESLSKATPKEIAFMLAEQHNQLEFRRGNLVVNGYETLKMQALMVADEFEGNKKQVRSRPYKYRLLNPEKMQKETVDSQYAEFYATEKAVKCRKDQMLAFAYNLNIDITDQTEAGLRLIRSKFIAKAKENPTFFNKQFDNPVNRVKWLVFEGLKQGVISHGQLVGKVTWADTQAELFDIDPQKDAVTEISDKIVRKHTEAFKMYTKLKGLVLAEQEEETAPAEANV